MFYRLSLSNFFLIFFNVAACTLYIGSFSSQEPLTLDAGSLNFKNSW